MTSAEGKEDDTVKKEYLINWQGNDFVKYEGLLDEAHQQGLCRVSTTLIQVPSPDNGNVAIVAAEVETSKGTFSGIGDAAPNNVNRMIVPHLVRMAETRAKARALRDAINVGVTALEELGDLDEAVPAPASPRPAVRAAETAEPYRAERADFPKASPNKPASANQLATIAKLSRLLGHAEEPESTMSSAEASERITELSHEYNERKGAPVRRSA